MIMRVVRVMRVVAVRVVRVVRVVAVWVVEVRIVIVLELGTPAFQNTESRWKDCSLSW